MTPPKVCPSPALVTIPKATKALFPDAPEPITLPEGSDSVVAAGTLRAARAATKAHNGQIDANLDTLQSEQADAIQRYNRDLSQWWDDCTEAPTQEEAP